MLWSAGLARPGFVKLISAPLFREARAMAALPHREVRALTALVAILGSMFVWGSCTGEDLPTSALDEAGSKSARDEGLAPAAVVPVSVTDNVFTPKFASANEGDVIQWNFNGPSNHNATDNSGMGLFASGDKSPGSSFSFGFVAAGRYLYRCTLHAGQTGEVRVAIMVAPASGTTSTTFLVTWASGDPPAGYVFDVQIQRPGSSFVNWQSGTTARSANFVPDAGAGTYAFRSRLRNTANGKSSKLSASTSITVTGSTTPGLQLVTSGLVFPLYLTAPAGDSRLFIVEKGGPIRVFKNGQLLTTPFLNLTGKVSTGFEQGLLSMVFHPNYAANGRFFVDYTNLAGDTRVVEYEVSANPDVADPTPVKVILGVDQPFANHNGGLILFGPDGKMYVGLGDGGGSGDPLENGQEKGTLLGKILRIDVDAGSPYVIPADNPFVGEPGARGEIWTLGMRNPWRFSFDRVTSELYIADVGQDRFEEVDAAPAGVGGQNYGWDIMEGSACFEPMVGCNQTGLTLPVLEYDHTQGCSITGGYVYRGSALPDLVGKYFYSDYCSGFMRSFKLVGGVATNQQSWPTLEPGESVVSFGEDSAAELYVMTDAGTVHKFVPN